MNNTKLLIDNQWINPDNNEYIDVISPWDLQSIGKVASGSKKQAEKAILSAENAFKTWRKTSLSYRISILNKFISLVKENKQEIVSILSKEIGKFEKDAESEIDRSLEYIALTIDAVRMLKGNVYYGDIFETYPKGRKTGIYNREPLGVVLAIPPFNYPINLSITKIAPALITGNTVVLKPSSQGALASEAFYKHLVNAGLDSGVFNIISGKSSEIGDYLTSHDRVSLIAFTGSTNVGKHIKEISKGIPLLLELGGKDFAIVTDKADLDITSEQIASGAFSYCGQRCTAQKGVIVMDNVAEELIKKLCEKAKALELNPMISIDAAENISTLINDAKQKGAEVVLEGFENNNRLQPTIVSKVKEDMRLFKEEQFGPVLPIILAKDEQEAVNLVQKSSFGLQASVYTKDIEQAFRIADQLEVGTVQINGKGDRGPDNFPFGGVKDSGQYMQGAVESLELMTRGKLIVINRYN